MLDSIYHMTLKLLKIAFLTCSENVIILLSFMQHYNGRLYITMITLLNL